MVSMFAQWLVAQKPRRIWYKIEFLSSFMKRRWNQTPSFSIFEKYTCFIKLLSEYGSFRIRSTSDVPLLLSSYYLHEILWSFASFLNCFEVWMNLKWFESEHVEMNESTSLQIYSLLMYRNSLKRNEVDLRAINL